MSLYLDAIHGSKNESLDSIYAKIMLNYYDANIEGLKALSLSLKESLLKNHLGSLFFQWLVARIEIRTMSAKKDSIDQLIEKVKPLDEVIQDQNLLSILRGETYFISGLISEVILESGLMRQYYEMAYNEFIRSGVEKKALKSYHNIIAANSRIDPNWNGRNEYYFLYKKAKKIKAYTVAGTALYNLSLELERMGVLNEALKISAKAISLLHYELGSRVYFLCLCHQIHLFFQLGRVKEAKEKFGLLKDVSFVELKSVVVMLDYLLNSNSLELKCIDPKKLTPAWQRKLTKELENAPNQITKLSPSESRLVQILLDSPKNKFEIIEVLYGNEKNILAAENRLNNLLNRLKKKSGLVYYYDGKYWISSTHVA